MIARFVDWMFRDRATGKIVIGQFPNIPLILWLVATLLSAVTSGTASDALGYAATLALVVWAGDELIRGVNPFRQIAGRDGARLGAGLPRTRLIAAACRASREVATSPCR